MQGQIVYDTVVGPRIWSYGIVSRVVTDLFGSPGVSMKVWNAIRRFLERLLGCQVRVSHLCGGINHT